MVACFAHLNPSPEQQLDRLQRRLGIFYEDAKTADHQNVRFPRTKAEKPFFQLFSLLLASF
jgi:hypothetical protein